MAPEATLPRGDVSVPGDYFSLAGFEVIMHGRFWVRTEDVTESIRRHFKPELREPDEELGLGRKSTAIAFVKEDEDRRLWDYFEEF
jgi:hypothetical protein